MKVKVKDKLRARRAREQKLRKHRDMLEKSVRAHLIPALVQQGFEVAPSQESSDPVDRDYVLSFPAWGHLIRTRGSGVDLLEIQFSSYRRAAFRINACAVPEQGMITLGGPRTIEECVALGVHDFEMYAHPRLWRFFQLLLWRFRSPVQAHYDKLVQWVASLIPELELALREGKLGAHMRRLKIAWPAPLADTNSL